MPSRSSRDVAARPRPNLPSIVAMARRGFELSEASNTPVMMTAHPRVPRQGKFHREEQ